MTNEKKMLKINKLPAPTYRYLKMNYAETEETAYAPFRLEEISLSGAQLADGGSIDVKTGCGEELTALLDNSGIPVMVISAAKPGASAKYDLSFAEGQNAASRCEIRAAAGADVTVTQFIESGKSGSAAVQTALKAEEGAKIHLIQVISCGEDFRLINDIGTSQQDRAAATITQLYLSGKETAAGVCAGLAGYRAEYKNDIAYLLKDTEKLDINLLASHTGRKTLSEITAKGVLSNKAQKIFRGTIDFVNGASGAKGAENEEVLMMNEGVVNKTVPLILCAEEDVEGSHGASIGKLDENHVFYMMSRGLTLEMIYKIMARAKLEAVMRSIGDEETLARIEKRIGGVDADEQENNVG